MTLDDVAVIRKLDFFESLDDKIVKRIAQQCFDREFAAGDSIIRQGEPGLGLYFITGGRVKVELDNQGTLVEIAELGAGDCVGELAIVDDRARSANVVCLENTKCLLLTRDSFSKLMNKHPQLAIQMVKALVSRLRATNARIGQPAPEPGPGSAGDPVETTPADSSNGNGNWSLRPNGLFQTYATTKGVIKDLLVDVFSPLYVARAVTRFSMAVIGCPVTVKAENEGRGVLTTTIQDVKICLFPACEDQTLRLAAFGDGDISVTVLRPLSRFSGAPAFQLDGRIHRHENWRLHVPCRRRIWMEVPSGEAVDASHSL